MTHLINKGLICPYCSSETEYTDSLEVYSKSYGMIYICKPCDAWVGTHKGDPTQALGRVANAELRELKTQVHKLFDPLWEKAVKVRGWSKQKARSSAYSWLAKRMLLPVEQCHIGMFDIERCQKAIKILQQYA